MGNKPLPNPNHEVYACLRSKGSRRIEAAKEAGFSPTRQNAHNIEHNPSNGIRERIASLQAAQFDPELIDEAFISGSLAKEAVDPDNAANVRVSALKVLADVRKLTGSVRANVEPERLSKEERDDMLKQLLYHSQREHNEGNTIDIEANATESKPKGKTKAKAKPLIYKD
jgi:uncharacterized phage protein gp47/JayE